MTFLKNASLPKEILSIIKNKNTEYPFSGIYNDFKNKGTYLCRQCGLALYRSTAKFNSSCGWPSFDKEIENNIKKTPDPDGVRTEILCGRCDAHLGHIFIGEGFTPLNIRHCVNSLSLDFVEDNFVLDSREAIFAAGCFWGVEFYFKKIEGVLKVESGYTGGSLDNPSYEEICQGTTGHYEAVRVVFDESKVSYKTLAKYFFEIHDPTQSNGQGPDLGDQYLSAIFYYSDTQKEISSELISILENRGYNVATKILPVSTFWPAENYHQGYYEKTNKMPYCHQYKKLFF